MSPAKKAMNAEEFRKLLDKSGISQVQLAKLLGVEKGTVNRWYLGKRGIDQFKAAAIREALAKK